MLDTHNNNQTYDYQQWNESPLQKKGDPLTRYLYRSSQSFPHQAKFQGQKNAELGPSSNADFQGSDMVWVKFRSTIAAVDARKNPTDLIGSGGTQYFFFSGKIFIFYEKIDEEQIFSAIGNFPDAEITSSSSISIVPFPTTVDLKLTVMGKGTVELPIGNGIVEGTFHASKFSTNIISFGMIIERFGIRFTCATDTRTSKCHFTGPDSNKTISRVRIKDELHLTTLTSKNRTEQPIWFGNSLACIKWMLITTRPETIDSDIAWHGILGNPLVDLMVQF